MTDNGSLKSLHTTLVDAQKGYETAIADAETPEIKAFFERIASLHQRAHSDIHAILLAKGERADDSGSFLSVVHKTVISVRSAVAGLDRSSLPSFADGEERIVGAYDRAIADLGASDPSGGTLRMHRDALVATIAEMKQMAA